MKTLIIRSGAFLLASISGVFLVAASGIIPIRASDGHWAITRWFLQFSKERSIATQTLTLDAPPLDDPAWVVKGAGHFEQGCRSCHGAPGRAPSRIARMMLPRPPDLVPVVRKREAEELFHVVKHGIKLTGMPAWPAQQRDDEVWAVVAFLQQLPELDPETYRQLVNIDLEAGAVEPVSTPVINEDDVALTAARSCAQCHGDDGRGNAAFPKLAGQRREYLENALRAYARGERYSGMMEPVAAALDDETMRGLSEYYAHLPVRAPQGKPEPAEPALLERGRLIATRGVPERRIPACAECHDPAGRRARPAYPSLAAQPSGYLELQLQLFQRGQRGGSEYAHLMEEVAGRLRPDDVQAVAAYFASLPSHNASDSGLENNEPRNDQP